jgi:hypothetical protein
MVYSKKIVKKNKVKNNLKFKKISPKDSIYNKLYLKQNSNKSTKKFTKKYKIPLIITGTALTGVMAAYLANKYIDKKYKKFLTITQEKLNPYNLIQQWYSGNGKKNKSNKNSPIKDSPNNKSWFDYIPPIY